MDSYTENEIKKGQAVPDLFEMVPPLHTIHEPSCLLLVLDVRNETREEGVVRIGQAVSALFGEAKKIHQTVSDVFAF